jgi:hypothetical protein
MERVQPPSDSFVVTIVQEPTEEITIEDVVVGSLGIVGTLVLVAIVLGGVLSLVFLGWNRRRPPESYHMPPVSPLVPTPDGHPTAPEQ